jgi:hypothetical protein
MPALWRRTTNQRACGRRRTLLATCPDRTVLIDVRTGLARAGSNRVLWRQPRKKPSRPMLCNPRRQSALSERPGASPGRKSSQTRRSDRGMHRRRWSRNSIRDWDYGGASRAGRSGWRMLRRWDHRDLCRRHFLTLSRQCRERELTLDDTCLPCDQEGTGGLNDEGRVV